MPTNNPEKNIISPENVAVETILRQIKEEGLDLTQVQQKEAEIN